MTIFAPYPRPATQPSVAARAALSAQRLLAVDPNTRTTFAATTIIALAAALMARTAAHAASIIVLSPHYRIFVDDSDLPLIEARSRA
jgi:hypothetical protein